tara:strand:+ start:122 stop:1081 length:960 start_codon:yes stop_codon:yes gene_type:complete
MLPIHVLLREEDIVADFLASIENRTLTEKFFYWFPTSVRAWINLCSNGAYRNFQRSHELIRTSIEDISLCLPDGPFQVISLGAGQGVKDMLILDHLRTSGRPPYYIPIDASQYLLEMACLEAQERGYNGHGIKADISDHDHHSLWHNDTDNPGSIPRLMIMLGNTLGAFDPCAYAAQLAALLRPQDYLLVDGELFNASGTMAGYDNPINREFALAPLRSIGLIEPDDGSLNFEMTENSDVPGLYHLKKHFDLTRSRRILLAGEKVELETGERIEMNWSSKYSTGTFMATLYHAGLETITRYVSGDQQFVMALVRTRRRT